MTAPSPPSDAMAAIPWSDGTWRNPPVSVSETADGALVAEALEGSDAWRTTAYGFVHDSEHALLRPFAPGTAMEVDFVAGASEQFDQGGLLIRADSTRWIKAGTEFADGVLTLSTVVTDELSDWSSAPVPAWHGATVTIRASWSGDAITVRARVEDTEFQLCRVAPWRPGGADVLAGPHLAAPTRPGLRVEFTAWRVGPADDALH